MGCDFYQCKRKEITGPIAKLVLLIYLGVLNPTLRTSEREHAINMYI